MHPLTSMLLYQTVMFPVDPAQWPTRLTRIEDSTQTVATSFRWEDARTLIAETVDDPEEYRQRWEFDPDGRLLRVHESSKGIPSRTTLEYSYADGRLSSGREGDKTLRYHYVEARLDSMSRSLGDTLVGYLKYAYDGQGRLVRLDDLYDLDLGEDARHRRFSITYHLPDSIVEEYQYFDNPDDYGRKVIRLQGDRPVRMIEVEHFFEEEHVVESTWSYGGTRTVRRGIRLPAIRISRQDINVLGRRLPAKHRPAWRQ